MHQNLDSKDTRPVNLDLFSIKFPITAIVSILHRVSGFLLFLIIPVLLYLWQYSLTSDNNFLVIKNYLSSGLVKLLLWATITGLFYHLLAGVRHILMDKHIGDSKEAGKKGAFIVVVLSAVAAVLVGVYLYG